MPQHHWTVLCQQVITDQDSNLVSYINAIEQIATTDFPKPFPRLYLSTLWRKEGEGDVIVQRITVTDDKGEVVFQPDPSRKEFEQYERYRLNRIVGGFDVEEPGELEFLVEYKKDDEWLEAARFKIPVILVDLEDVKGPVARAPNSSGT